MSYRAMLESSGEGATCPAFVAQVSNLLYRRFPIGRASKQPARSSSRATSGLENSDTGDWKTALRGGTGAACFVAQVSDLLYRRFPIGRASRQPALSNC